MLFRLFNHALEGHEVGLTAAEHRKLFQVANITRYRQLRNAVLAGIAE